MHKPLTLIGTVISVALAAGCASSEPGSVAEEQPAQTGLQDVTVLSAYEASPQGTEDRCADALAAEANVPLESVSDVGTTSIPTGWRVTLSLEGAAEPWQCDTDIAGEVLSVMYLGEG